MIYEPVPSTEPIRQGDIFLSMPKLEINMGQMAVALDDEGFTEGPWDDVSAGRETVSALVQARPITAIVISQDCDASRAQDISLCEVRPFHDVEGRDKNASDTPKKWVRLVTQHARMNQKWFYMPPAPEFRIQQKMAADFRVVVQLPLTDLEVAKIKHRVGRLNTVASTHFRERISEFFRRYAYDEWYPLTPDELEFYRRNSSEPIDPFPWQRPPGNSLGQA